MIIQYNNAIFIYATNHFLYTHIISFKDFYMYIPYITLQFIKFFVVEQVVAFSMVEFDFRVTTATRLYTFSTFHKRLVPLTLYGNHLSKLQKINSESAMLELYFKTYHSPVQHQQLQQLTDKRTTRKQLEISFLKWIQNWQNIKQS